MSTLSRTIVQSKSVLIIGKVSMAIRTKLERIDSIISDILSSAMKKQEMI